ncbi:hypothetical protein LAZ67_13002113 [Cordylochernes scorpioides]|uniref:HTH CENPB-type domain-containing protein n=1 Tax=Cordylochernes scorpioides TaxID=51811 RepID=A0ABY6L718_9ARAC|nr:hypothetical protein LAZ67_13002113 [Cordylochernes scorpioides]
MEKLLMVWVTEKQLQGDTLTQTIICEKARAIYGDLLKQTPQTSIDEASEESFKASRGWFENFKKRSGIHSVVRHGLFWKKMPNRTYITAEEKMMPGHKPMKDRLTLALCANASGDCKIKPLLVYHSENPRAFKSHKILKEKLQVMWRSNPKAWVTRKFFVEWVNLVFGPTVKKYLQENNLPVQALLILDNAPAHPPNLEDDILEKLKFIKVLNLPPNTTPILQPMDQQLWPEAVAERIYEELEPGVSVEEEIVSLGKSMGLEVEERDVNELIEEHTEELTTEEIQELQSQQHTEVMQVIGFEESEEEVISTREIKEILGMLERINGSSIVLYGEICFEIRVIQDTSKVAERIKLAAGTHLEMKVHLISVAEVGKVAASLEAPQPQGVDVGELTVEGHARGQLLLAQAFNLTTASQMRLPVTMSTIQEFTEAHAEFLYGPIHWVVDLQQQQLVKSVLDRLRFLPIKKNGSKNLYQILVKNEIKCADAFRMLTVAYGEATLDRSNVYRWYKHFNNRRKINEVEKMILANRQITVREVAEDLNISIGSCHSIFINDLGMRQVAAKFVPKLLNCDQKQHRMNIANEMLDSVRDDPNLLQRVITGDEAWVYGYDVETKAQSSQWKLPHEPRPKKARQVRSNVKVLLTVFFDCRGVVHHEFLPQGRTVNKEYYLQVMRNLREAIRQKRPDLWKNKNWLLHHDNAPAHTSLLARNFLAKNNTLMMPQPPYSPDMAPCDFFLFPKLKRPMKGRRYAMLDEIKTASKEELKKIFKNDFLKCFEDWKNCWHKCIISHGDYFEGNKIGIHE